MARPPTPPARIPARSLARSLARPSPLACSLLLLLLVAPLVALADFANVDALNRTLMNAAAVAHAEALARLLDGGARGDAGAMLVIDAPADSSTALDAAGTTVLAGGDMDGYLAYYDAATETWKPQSPAGTFNDKVNTLGTFRGETIAGGYFTLPATRIAAWNGTAWRGLGEGFNGFVTSLTVFDNALIAGGDFVASGATASLLRIAQWDGTRWRAIGTGFDGTVRSVTIYNGRLVAGGEFRYAGSSLTYFVAQWTGTVWTAIGSGLQLNNFVLTLYASGNILYAGGWFNAYGNHAAQWAGSSWNAMSVGLDHWVYAFMPYGGGLVAGGRFEATGAGGAALHVATWNGGSWAPLSAGLNGEANAFFIYGNRLLAGGGFQTLGTGAQANYIAVWDNVTWAPFGTGLTNTVRALVQYTVPPTPPTPTPSASAAPPVGCELKGTKWRAQYYVNSTTLKPIHDSSNAAAAAAEADAETLTGTVLVGDVLELLHEGTYRQNLTSYPSSNCTANWIHWDGGYEYHLSGAKLTLERRRCTQTSTGCIACTPTTIETGAVAFNPACERMEFTPTGAPSALVYFSDD